MTHDYAPLRCKTHNKASCEECMTTASSAHDAGLVIKQTAYDKIHRVDYSCSTHADSAMIVACKKCVQEQLKAEHKRGLDAADAATMNVTELRTRLSRAHTRVSDYYKEMCDLRVAYTKAREQIEFAHRLINMMKESCRDNPLVLKNIKEWEAL